MLKISRLSALAMATVMGVGSMGFAQTGPSLVTVPFDEGIVAEFEVSYQNQNDVDVDKPASAEEIGLQIYDAQARYKLTQDDLGLTFGAQVTAIDIASGTLLPDSLIDQSYALGFNLGQIKDWKVSTVLGLGYNGRTPYGDGDSLYGKADLIFTTQPSDTSMWQVMIDYDGNRSFMPDVPLPSIAYTDWSNPQFKWTLGVPYNSLTWMPDDKWELELTAILISNIEATLTYELTEEFEIFGSYASRTDAFRVDQDNRDNRRLIFSQQTLELGFSWEPCKEFELTVAGGKAFGTEFEYGFDSRDTDTVVELDDAAYFRIAAEMKF